MTVWPLITGFAGGVIAWVFTTALAQPFQRFILLRQEAALALAEFEDMPWINNPEATPPTKEWLDKRRAVYDKAGVALVAFAISNSFVTRLLYNRVLGRYRCYVRSAGSSLRTLAESYPGTQASDQLHKSVVSSLRIASGLAPIKRPLMQRLRRYLPSI
jgi:hypothetical protein